MADSGTAQGQQTYKVILVGTRPDVPVADARRKLATLFKTTTEQVGKLLAIPNYVLKRGQTKDMAAKYKAAIEMAGGVCQVEVEVPPVQLKSTYPLSITKSDGITIQSESKSEQQELGSTYAQEFPYQKLFSSQTQFPEKKPYGSYFTQLSLINYAAYGLAISIALLIVGITLKSYLGTVTNNTSESNQPTSQSGTAATSDVAALPTFQESESYTTVRRTMIASGWIPFHSPNADVCTTGDMRCKDRPEMESCAGSGMANCKFLWEKNGKFIAINTVGEDTTFSGFSNATVQPSTSASPQVVAVSQNIIGAWQCGPEVELAHFKDGTAVMHVQLPNGQGEVLIAGNYTLDGKRYIRQEQANRMLKYPPDIIPFPGMYDWKISAKGDTVLRSNYVIREFEVIPSDNNKFVIKSIRWVNWDGRDSVNTSRAQSETCYRADQQYSKFEVIRAGIPPYLIH